ncbi:hypothetical protein H7K28_06975 [Paenibacillus polymyxa]|jgi:hypothetical protein|uniref:hypothetical protein n=1 Tax=Paenibacillus polymyxa TaxID=1406 RepID=UPI0015802DFC|nr:hypothetical protein [Paenibacillus polymyxa]MBY0020775.1 hypothetical protein [Paenibacillus polymyxa]MBY0059079.1 hypothetical protein [Paenibacillus polymyxa]MBY0069666.1 hypothetical protein [Paenibacillus polymyxa]MBY0083283.1 hypothetical protein [Paenibacillus polymyxa]MBZ6441817.1 hypothetical protein [Paenibacillus polymyxa]
MTNEQYAKAMTSDKKAIDNMLRVMDKYGDNRWCLSDDVKRMCYFQLQEDSLLIEFEVLHKGVETLLNRGVQTIEFRDLGKLFEEAKTKYNPA